ncbi:Scr1 family TA system antitoxin-like transcriptional regulator [Streptomyces griseoviridis]|uniref:Scr1 family TA system antitoxin-like transcriptional regulator n=1 Tax=Streptomyces griseoviridis TaxID=45398 RepID=UPI0033D3B730
MLGTADLEEEAAVLVVLGVWLRSLRHAGRLRLTDVARPGVSAPTLHSWETGRAADPSLVRELLASYGVADEEIEWMISQLPPRGPGSRERAARRLYQMFCDWGGKLARARYEAVNRAASEVIEFGSVLLPASIRTPGYDAVVAGPGVCRESGPMTGFPGQRRVVLVDEAVLYRPVAADHSVLYRQLSHLLALLDREHPHPDVRGGLRVRVVPMDAAPRPFQDVGPLVRMTLLGRELLCRPGQAPSYLVGEALEAEHAESLKGAARSLGRQASQAAVARAKAHLLSVLGGLPAWAGEAAGGAPR